MLEGPPFAKELIDFVDKFSTTSFESVFRKTKLCTPRMSFSTTPPVSPSPNYANVLAQSLLQRSDPMISVTQPSNVARHTMNILLNSKGQRVDSQLRYSQNDVVDMKKRKLCNSYHLLGRCPYQRPYHSCTHRHGVKLNDKQLETLCYVARLTPCTSGLQCNNRPCISGHQCHHKSCTGNCRFPKEMHGVDLNVV
jgi:hypothetical protein